MCSRSELGAVTLELLDGQVGRIYHSPRESLLRTFREDEEGTPISVYGSFEERHTRLTVDPSPPILLRDSIIFSDALTTQEPEIFRLSLSGGGLENLSADESPQYSPAKGGAFIFWFDERYLASGGLPVGSAITVLAP